jgi:hypothetical protein
MKTKILTTAILICSCLTSWAWFAKSITQTKVNQIQLGRTTEPQLVELFGLPNTRFVDIRHVTSLDWFRSVPPPVSGYLPIVGSFLGGLRMQVQHLAVVLDASGRVLRYEIYDSTGAVKARSQRLTTIRETRYSK